MPRGFGAAVAALICTMLLAGCFGVRPYAVADHDEKRRYHVEAGRVMVESDLLGGLSGVRDFASVGYMHGVAGGAELHVQKESIVMGGTVVTRETTDDARLTIDMVHIEGSDMNYYLFGEAYLGVTRTPWLAEPGRDVRREGDGLCVDVSAVWFLCNIMEAWWAAQEEHAEALPFRLETNADGSRHYVTALTPASLEAAGLFTFDEELSAKLGEQALQGFIPLHVWIDQDGVVSKLEANGVLTGERETLEMQFGFELTGVPSEDDRPIDPATLDPSVITVVTDPVRLQAMWDEITRIRHSA
ncbi:MAG: hypothetical protein Q4E05_03310 [Pseudoclavibacter sp.]|nr:hypothetical protein [Pseudoclavibacter sp.]